MNYIYSAVGCIIIIFVLLILKKEKKVRADYLLIAINLLMGAFLFSDILVNWKLTSFTVIFQNAIPLLLFPVFIFYLLQYTHSGVKISSSWYLTFVPLILFCSLSIVDHFILRNYATEQSIASHFNTPSIGYQIIFKASQILFIVLLISMLRALKEFKLKLKRGYSSIESIDVKWLEHFTWIYLLSMIMTMLLFLGQNLGLIPLEIKSVYGIIYGVLTVAIFYMNYQGIQHYTLSQVHQSHDTDKESAPNRVESPEAKPPITAEKSTELNDVELATEQEILEKIEHEQLYLNPKLSLDDLAIQTQLNKHLVSKVINAREGRSFYDLINGYRVEHLKKLLDDPRNKSQTILALGLDSGFNSKASMNRIFKNVSKITPKQYLDQQLQTHP